MNIQSSSSLSGKIIVLTRSQHQQAESRALFEAKGAKVLDLPALLIGPPDDWSPLDNALLELDDFHWIIFSSSNGVNAVEERLNLIGSSLFHRPKSLKIAAVGKKTAKTLKSFDVIPDFVPPQFIADSLINDFPVSAVGLRVLIPRVQTGGRTFLSQSLGEAGARVTEVSAYESKCPSTIPSHTINAFINKRVDAIVFTSGKTVAHTFQLLQKSFGGDIHKILLGVKLISIGPQTSISCKKYFHKVDKEASPHDLDGLLDACIKSMKI